VQRRDEEVATQQDAWSLVHVHVGLIAGDNYVAVGNRDVGFPSAGVQERTESPHSNEVIRRASIYGLEKD
jgi:hypothetical protein